MTSVYANPFLEPPRDAVAQHPTVVLSLFVILAAASVIFGVIYTYRTRSPLYFWVALLSVTVMPLLAEPLGDWLIAVWYPENHPTVFHPFNRTVPWLSVFFYLAIGPTVTVGAWELVKRGASAGRFLAFIAFVSLIEVPLEMLGSHFNWIMYYGNHSVLFGVPIYCIPQNGGVFAIAAATMAWLMPRAHGWRWLLVPVGVVGVVPVVVIAASWPAYLAINLQAGPALGWVGGIAALVLNTAAVVACAYAPPVRRLREAAARRSLRPAASAAAVPAV